MIIINYKSNPAKIITMGMINTNGEIFPDEGKLVITGVDVGVSVDGGISVGVLVGVGVFVGVFVEVI